MVGFVILGMLAAFGALCVLWALFGLLLPGAKGGALVCLCQNGSEEAIVRRYFWLRDLGLLRCPLVLLESTWPEEKRRAVTERCHNVQFYALEEFIAGLERRQRL